MLKLQLRPLVGALVSLVLYTLLSWQVLPGIKIENVGSYFLIAFLSGFSERYFLQLVKTDPESSNGQVDIERTTGDDRFVDEAQIGSDWTVNLECPEH